MAARLVEAEEVRLGERGRDGLWSATVRGVAIEIGFFGAASRFLSAAGKSSGQPANFCPIEIVIFFRFAARCAFGDASAAILTHPYKDGIPSPWARAPPPAPRRTRPCARRCRPRPRRRSPPCPPPPPPPPPPRPPPPPHRRPRLRPRAPRVVATPGRVRLRCDWFTAK